MANYSRKCKTCGRWINLREMPHGKWVAFEGDQPHNCKSPRVIKIKPKAKPKPKPTLPIVEDFPSINVPGDANKGPVAGPTPNLEHKPTQAEFPSISVPGKSEIASAATVQESVSLPHRNIKTEQTAVVRGKSASPHKPTQQEPPQTDKPNEATTLSTKRRMGLWGWLWAGIAIYLILSLFFGVVRAISIPV